MEFESVKPLRNQLQPEDQDASEEATHVDQKEAGKGGVLNRAQIERDRSEGLITAEEADRRLGNVLQHEEAEKYDNAIQIFEQRGVSFVMTIGERKRRPLFDIVTLFVAGGLQLIAGCVCCAVGAANFGASLLGEGVGDILKGVRTVGSGEAMNWGNYALEKLAAMATCGKAARLDFKKAAKLMNLGKTGTKLSRAKAVLRHFGNTAKGEGLKKGGKVAGIALVKHGFIDLGAGYVEHKLTEVAQTHLETAIMKSAPMQGLRRELHVSSLRHGYIRGKLLRYFLLAACTYDQKAKNTDMYAAMLCKIPFGSPGSSGRSPPSVESTRNISTNSFASPRRSGVELPLVD